MMYRAKTAAEAWEMVYKDLRKQNLSKKTRGGVVHGEMQNVMVFIEKPHKKEFSPIRNASMTYAVGELLYYLSGSNILEPIAKLAPFWKSISPDGETVNSAYGHKIQNYFGFDQWDYVKELLKRDPWTRRAIIHIKPAEEEDSKDIPCTLSLQFQVTNDGKLTLTTVMRSNDIWLGFPYDVFCFTSLQQLMAYELGYKIGEYCHIAGNMHLYAEHTDQEVLNEKDNIISE